MRKTERTAPRTPIADLLPLIQANRSRLTAWEASFLENIERTEEDRLSPKQRDWAAIIHTRLEVQNRRPTSHAGRR